MYTQTSNAIYKILVVIAVIIIIALAMGFADIASVMAKGESSLGYIHNTVSVRDCSNRIHFQYHNDDPYTCGQSVTAKSVKVTTTETTETTETTTTESHVLSDNHNPVIVVTDETHEETHEDKKDHCDNGEGNGKEGCNASDNGNNDEDNTLPKDKPAKSSSVWLVVTLLVKIGNRRKLVKLYNVINASMEAYKTGEHITVYFEDEEDGHSVWVINDKNASITEVYPMKYGDFDQEITMSNISTPWVRKIQEDEGL